MKKKVFDFIKKSKRAYIYKVRGEQWISDGCAGWSMEGLPEFDGDEIRTMCDIKEDDTAFEITTLKAAPAVHSGDGKRIHCDSLHICIRRDGENYSCITYDGGIIFINQKYIKHMEKNFFIYDVAQIGKQRMLCFYNHDDQLKGWIMPAQIVGQGFYNTVWELTKRLEQDMRTRGTENEYGMMEICEADILGDVLHGEVKAEQMEI